ncbi:hypothetical protein BCR41DRAFT_348255 [Lobosporangium transversale]|uniref:Uncharacterized protein n=1 Tax=Lobosporangium transversale TaxID=64571 RepID=A0A1Y2GVY0_9FUNG|nr:hypothetical protein BCR41DRAFT_348255 [Lobosporangium transversale]ORZ26415.1 hypothetical protein BCR41DRAFT_348255 [Lobosporangium transversale]|eukprot:XP_021884180.1 hypothetical protein BCR41DRAFT_348255 [Lobosporangium transversale]
MPFGSNGKSLARTLAGLLIQSGDAVLLALKVEVYGRLPSQDAQGQDVALPGRNPFSVVNSRHDNADKVMIGTLGWNALVTLAVILTNGKVVVGPHNPDFYPHRSSHVWVRKNGSEDSFNNLERQTRSKFHVQSTFETYAAACVEFNFYKTMPATLKTLWEYKINGVWSGVKAAAFVFYQLYTNHKLVKTEVERCVADAFAHNDRGCEILDAVNRMLAVMVDEEKVPVSKDVSKCLTEIAGRLQSEISDVNRGKVTKAVEKRIRMILEEPT